MLRGSFVMAVSRPEMAYFPLRFHQPSIIRFGTVSMNNLLPSTFRWRSPFLGIVLAVLLVGPLPELAAQQRAEIVSGNQIFRPSTRPVDPTPLGLSSTNRAMTLDVDVRAFQAVAAPAMTLLLLRAVQGWKLETRLLTSIIGNGVIVLIALLVVVLRVQRL